MKTCASWHTLAHWLTLEWISEERDLTGGAVFDSQPSKEWLSKKREWDNLRRTGIPCMCVWLRVCVCVMALLLVGISLDRNGADGRLWGSRTLSVFIYSDFTLHPSITAALSSAWRCSCFPSFVHPADDPMRVKHASSLWNIYSCDKMKII